MIVGIATLLTLLSTQAHANPKIYAEFAARGTEFSICKRGTLETHPTAALKRHGDVFYKDQPRSHRIKVKDPNNKPAFYHNDDQHWNEESAKTFLGPRLHCTMTEPSDFCRDNDTRSWTDAVEYVPIEGFAGLFVTPKGTGNTMWCAYRPPPKNGTGPGEPVPKDDIDEVAFRGTEYHSCEDGAQKPPEDIDGEKNGVRYKPEGRPFRFKVVGDGSKKPAFLAFQHKRYIRSTDSPKNWKCKRTSENLCTADTAVWVEPKPATDVDGFEGDFLTVDGTGDTMACEWKPPPPIFPKTAMRGTELTLCENGAATDPIPLGDFGKEANGIRYQEHDERHRVKVTDTEGKKPAFMHYDNKQAHDDSVKEHFKMAPVRCTRTEPTDFCKDDPSNWQPSKVDRIPGFEGLFVMPEGEGDTIWCAMSPPEGGGGEEPSDKPIKPTDVEGYAFRGNDIKECDGGGEKAPDGADKDSGTEGVKMKVGEGFRFKLTDRVAANPTMCVYPRSKNSRTTDKPDEWKCMKGAPQDLCTADSKDWKEPKPTQVEGFEGKFITMEGEGDTMVCEFKGPSNLKPRFAMGGQQLGFCRGGKEQFVQMGSEDFKSHNGMMYMEQKPSFRVKVKDGKNKNPAFFFKEDNQAEPADAKQAFSNRAKCTHTKPDGDFCAADSTDWEKEGFDGVFMKPPGDGDSMWCDMKEEATEPKDTIPDADIDKYAYRGTEFEECGEFGQENKTAEINKDQGGTKYRSNKQGGRFAVIGSGTSEPSLMVYSKTEKPKRTSDVNNWRCAKESADDLCSVDSSNWKQPKKTQVDGFEGDFLSMEGEGDTMVCEWTEEPKPVPPSTDDESGTTTTTEEPAKIAGVDVGPVLNSLPGPVKDVVKDVFGLFRSVKIFE